MQHQRMSTTPVSPAAQDGRGAALAVYVLYLLSIPSAAIFALIGVIVALMIGGGVLMGTLAFGGQKYFEYQRELSEKQAA